MKHLLTVAGSDSSGGAGIQADLKTFAAHGCYGMSVITSVTAQNTTGVTAAEDLSPEIIRAQLEAVFSDIRVDAVKVGMVSCGESIHAVAEKLAQYRPPVLVIDPVMVSKNGFPLLRPEAREVFEKELLPLATVLTPNIPEAEILSGMDIATSEDMKGAATALHERYGCSVLVKGGHMQTGADDLLYDGTCFRFYREERIRTKNTHGTGCTLSSALAAHLARGIALSEAVWEAKEYVTDGIRHAVDLGAGCGPLHHFYDLYQKAGIGG